MKAYVFPGQGAQFTGMGKDLYDNFDEAKELFHKANEILGFDISRIMFEGTADELKETKVTQPAVFLHSVILAKVMGDVFTPDMVAGHSLGELSALTAIGSLSFEDGLRIVSERAIAMQAACELQASTMAAILGLEDDAIEKVCRETSGVVVAANYNCPGQLVISGEIPAVEAACKVLKEKGAKRALVLPVGGAFHSPLMEPARERLAKAIDATEFEKPICPIYQNVTNLATTATDDIITNLIYQLTAPVKWTQSIQEMIKDGATEFIEVGPGKALQGMIGKIDRNIPVSQASV
ncbi:[acyl-carrier-protein] S-malonyltransferase [Nonlabens sp. Hel1_33_55]|uniref:ACP S-malonyltransferase n=1 Tax=Nonlabens sp. Hel1_33_55 TaxID=1336802 RepID=UPI000875DA41|nr:ACP S-malonyltransferase [Nonlabens sp. Hel1_33_55]SCY38854.1 [acyl-carrier-protein] S-malonyltransferase [Nonlabens sp. Hel1_33_55]